MKRPDYINKKVKKVSKKELLKAIEEVEKKNKALNQSHRDGYAIAMHERIICY